VSTKQTPSGTCVSLLPWARWPTSRPPLRPPRAGILTAAPGPDGERVRLVPEGQRLTALGLAPGLPQAHPGGTDRPGGEVRSGGLPDDGSAVAPGAGRHGSVTAGAGGWQPCALVRPGRRGVHRAAPGPRRPRGPDGPGHGRIADLVEGGRRSPARQSANLAARNASCWLETDSMALFTVARNHPNPVSTT